MNADEASKSNRSSVLFCKRLNCYRNSLLPWQISVNFFPLRAGPEAGLDEAAVSFLSDDQMVQNPEVDGSRGVHQGTGEVLILRGRLGITAGVVVDEDDPEPGYWHSRKLPEGFMRDMQPGEFNSAWGTLWLTLHNFPQPSLPPV